MLKIIVYVLIGTGSTFLATILGSATVFLFRGSIKREWQRIFLGFAAGVMIAASIWSLLIPAMDLAEQNRQISIIPVAGGFILGGLFLMILDKLLPHFHPGTDKTEGLPSGLHRSTMLVIAVTLHNIPEGMAVGLTFALAAESTYPGALASAIALAIGMGLQNFPEGAAISLPLKKEGFSNWKAFLYGSLSGIVEPIAGLMSVYIASGILGIMPWILAFAAGAMIYVVVEELIPEAHLGEHSHIGTASVMVGFLIMMVLDVTLG